MQTSEVKSSKQVICRIASELLSGEGDIIRHLYMLGYSVNFDQHLMDEFEFRVHNVATDLRDGIRLVRLFEIASGTSTLSLCKVS